MPALWHASGMHIISPCGVCNSKAWVLKSTIYSPSPHATATVLSDCLTAVATAAADVATAAAAVATGRHSICLHHHSQQWRLEPVGITAPPVADGGAARTCGSSVAKFCARQFSGARYQPGSAHRQPNACTTSFTLAMQMHSAQAGHTCLSASCGEEGGEAA